MAKQIINVGTSANDGTGDTLRAAAQKINANFTEVYETSQGSFDKANTTSDSVNNLTPQIQSAWNTANAAYNAANTGGGSANTGTITFIDDLIEGQYGVSISPYSLFTSNNQYFRFRGGDDERHLHFDSSDSNQFDLFLGDDLKFVQLNHEGNVIIQSHNTDSYVTNTWTFDRDGNIVFPDTSIQKTAASNYKKILTVTTPGLTYLDETDEIVFCDVNAAGDNINIYLPTSPIIGQTITVKNINTDGNVAFVQADVGQYFETLNHTIDNGGYETLPLTSHAATWIWDGSTWRIINYYTG